ncbi:MAG: Lrp/AsnC family transcriptional regulator [Gemmatimonadaceae bacterium]|nr:Lrp/AsnC family transcriptional regulator [Gemmatimonadaceae bacterium]
MPNNVRKRIDPTLIDRIDRDILAYLQHDARISNKALSAQVGLAPSSCLARVKRLEASGVLLGYHAEVDPRAYGATLEALIAIRLEKHARNAIAAFEGHIGTLPEVRGAFHVAGANDYLVHVAVRDAEHLREFALSAFATRSEVAHMETSLIFSHRRNPSFGTVPSSVPWRVG